MLRLVVLIRGERPFCKDVASMERLLVEVHLTD
jgi:hypothetical protein